MTEETLTGRLTSDVVAPGSKSERQALVLETDDGRVLVVRAAGATTFGAPDADLTQLAEPPGAPVELTGRVVAGTLLATAWRRIG